LRNATKLLEELAAVMRLTGVDGELAHQAGEAAWRHSLRGYDAVHLVSAMAFDDAQLVMVTWDAELSRAAQEVGLVTVP
jgi:predicted nucleic acid-binding protein